MSNWQEHDMTTKIESILRQVSVDHHFGGFKFMSAYQIALTFQTEYQETFAELGYPIGGKGSGVDYSLGTYIANHLSEQIKIGNITTIEGAWLASDYMPKPDSVPMMTLTDNDSNSFEGQHNAEYKAFSLYRLRE